MKDFILKIKVLPIDKFLLTSFWKFILLSLIINLYAGKTIILIFVHFRFFLLEMLVHEKKVEWVYHIQ